MRLSVILFCFSINAWGQEFRYMDLGWQAANRNQFDSAIFFYDLSLKEYPSEAIAHKFRGMAFHQKGNYRKAIVDFTLALKANVDSSDVLFERTKSYQSLGKYDSAIDDLSFLIKKKSEIRIKAQLLSTKGFCHLQKKEFEKAESSLNESIRLDSLNFFSMSSQTVLYMQTNRIERALANSFSLIKHFPQNAMSYHLCGLCYIVKKNIRESMHYLRIALYLSPENAAINSSISLMYNFSAKYDSALFFAEKATVLNNHLAEAFESKGIALFGLLKYSTCVDNLNRAIQINPNLEQSYLFRGKCYYGLKKYALAEIDFKKSVKLNNQNEESFLFLGYIYKDQGKKSEACLHWKKAFDLGAFDIKDEMDRFCK